MVTINILNWFNDSGLELKYTNKAINTGISMWAYRYIRMVQKFRVKIQIY